MLNYKNAMLCPIWEMPFNSYMSLFTNDAELMNIMSKEKNCDMLQQDLDKNLWLEMQVGDGIQHQEMQCNGAWKEQADYMEACQGVQ